MRLVFFLLIFIYPLLVYGQEDSTLITKNFKFEDGIYFQLRDLQSNQPSLLWQDVQANLFTNPQNFITKVDFIKKDSIELPLDSIWAVVLGGIPYVQLPDSLEKKGIDYFAGLQVRGNICYFEYEEKVLQKIPMAAYNPVIGNAFRSAVIEREVTINKQKMLRFSTGAIANFTKTNLLEWIKEDAALQKSVQALQSEEIEEKLFKCLLIYDDRHPIYLKDK